MKAILSNLLKIDNNRDSDIIKFNVEMSGLRVIKKPIKTSDIYVDELVGEMGWTYLSEGLHSIVLKHPYEPDLVKKVTFETEDDPYIPYIKWCAENPNIHLPKVLSIKNMGRFYTIDMEKLSELDESCHIEMGTMNYIADVLWGYQPNPPDYVQPTLVNITNKMYETFRKYGFYNDVHEANVMYREDVPVITDPFCL